MLKLSKPIYRIYSTVMKRRWVTWLIRVYRVRVGDGTVGSQKRKEREREFLRQKISFRSIWTDDPFLSVQIRSRFFPIILSGYDFQFPYLAYSNTQRALPLPRSLFSHRGSIVTDCRDPERSFGIITLDRRNDVTFKAEC